MDFIGNKKSVSLLQSSLEKGSINHAYLFSGPQNVGKFTLAKMFALSAIAGTGLGLDVDEFNKDALLDLILVSPEVVEKNGVLKQRDISIESIRDVKQSLNLYPYHGKYKVMIINDAHKMNVSAQNAMLKILEEPNQTTILILVTNEIDRILPTILSRLQSVNFGLVSDEEIRKGFMNESVFSEEIVSLSIGRPGLASFLINSGEMLADRLEALKEFDKIKRESLNERFKLAEEFSKDVVSTLEKMDIWIWELRKNAEQSDENERRRNYSNIEKILNSMSILKRTNANARIILETLFMDL